MNMRQHVVLVALGLTVLGPASSRASCLRWETQCTYDCVEYYPNGKDCRKTKKNCERVCVENSFDVDRGGIDDANRGVKPPATNGTAQRKTDAAPEVVITGRLEQANVAQHEVWIVTPSDATSRRAVKVYEIDPARIAVKFYKDKIVKIKGTLSWVKTAQNGYRQLVIADSIAVKH